MPKKLDRSAACRSWGDYVRYVADQWRLLDWLFFIEDGQPELKNVGAEVEANVRSRRATMRFSDDFLDCDDERLQRETIAHECLHAHFEACAQMAERHMGAHYADFLDMFEQGIEGAAKAFADKLLLPSEVFPAGTDDEMEID